MKNFLGIVAVIFGFIAGIITVQGYINVFQHNNIVTSPKASAQKTERIQPNTILYVSDQTGNQEIYALDLKTLKSINLTQNVFDDMNPQVSPDGKFIIFFSNRDGDNEIFRMKLEDRSVTQLTKNAFDDYDPTYSPNGKSIAYKSTAEDKRGDIFLMKADGSGAHNVTPTRPQTEEWDPTFSRDGKKIIFVTRSESNHLTDELAMINLDGSEFRQITWNTFPDWYPSVHPKLQRLLFTSKTDPNNPDDIYMSTSDGSARTQMTSLPGNDADPSWDIYGDRIVFINDQDGDYDIYTMNTDGSKQKKLFDTKKDELSPIFLSDNLN